MKPEKFQPTSDITLYIGSWQDVSFPENIDLIFTSPPYNIGSRAPRKDGFRRFGQFDPKSFGAIRGYKDKLPEDDYQRSQKEFLTRCSQIIGDSGVIAYNHKNRHKKGELISPERWFPYDVLVLHDEAVLDRRSSHNNEPTFLQPTTERLYIFKKSRSAKIYFDKKKFNSIRDLWYFPIVRDKDTGRHCAPFDLKFAREVVSGCCPPGGTVFDPYSGSGTTMLACSLEHRKFIGSEKMEKWFNKSIERFNFFKNIPV
jgi:DNA modification methylase